MGFNWNLFERVRLAPIHGGDEAVICDFLLQFYLYRAFNNRHCRKAELQNHKEINQISSVPDEQPEEDSGKKKLRWQ